MTVSTRTPLNLVVLGPPGAGKGTQGIEFARRHAIPQISTGDILRDAVKSGSGLGRRARATMDAGRLVDDALMIAIVRERLGRQDVAAGFVLDGFPRTVSQAAALDEIMAGRPLIVIDVAVPDDVLVARLARRRVCARCGQVTNADAAGSGCGGCGGELRLRSDDAESVVRERLRVYADATRPLVDYYSARPSFRAVDGDQSPARVAEALTDAVESVLAVVAGDRLAVQETGA